MPIACPPVCAHGQLSTATCHLHSTAAPETDLLASISNLSELMSVEREQDMGNRTADFNSKFQEQFRSEQLLDTIAKLDGASASEYFDATDLMLSRLRGGVPVLNEQLSRLWQCAEEGHRIPLPQFCNLVREMWAIDKIEERQAALPADEVQAMIDGLNFSALDEGDEVMI